MAKLTKTHKFNIGTRKFTIQPFWIKDEPLTYRFEVEAQLPDGAKQHAGTWTASWDEGPYGQAFIESDLFLAEKMTLLEKAIRKAHHAKENKAKGGKAK